MRRALTALAAAVLALAAGAADARPAGLAAPVTLTMIANPVQKPAFDVLIPNFERVYPGITIHVTYADTTLQYQLTTTELAAGNAPDLLISWPGCGLPISVCVLAKDGYLTPMVGVPWTRWSPPAVISASKYGQGLFVYSPTLSFWGLYTNDTLFRKLGLSIPTSFPQLLALCKQARADGTVAILVGQIGIGSVVLDLALATVYAHDRHWTGERRAGTTSFEGTPGWHQALQDLVEMNDAGCFQAGAAGTPSSLTAESAFAQGQGLMTVGLSSINGVIESLAPSFAYSQHPFPNASTASGTIAYLSFGSGPAVNAHAPAANQAAAQTFVNFIARPAQNALEAKLSGGISEYEFRKGQLPAYMASFAPLVAASRYALSPDRTWWNAGTNSALSTQSIGLLTGQTTIDEVLNAADAAWLQGPS